MFKNTCMCQYINNDVYGICCSLDFMSIKLINWYVVCFLPNVSRLCNLFNFWMWVKFIVCLERKICNYERFQIDKIPCARAFVVLKKKNNLDIHPHCSNFYKPATLANTHEVQWFQCQTRRIVQHRSLVLKKSYCH